jgi:hypothetical protein
MMQPQQQIPNNNGQNQLYPPSPYANGQFPSVPVNTLAPPPPQGPGKPSVGFVIGLVVLTLLFLLSAVLAGIFFVQMQDYKNNSDQKSAAAVATAKEQQKKELEQVFAEQSKEPLVTYTSPAELGGIVISYPKTWSAYVSEKGSSQPLDAYFHPNFVPASSGSSSESFNYALRAQVLQQSYQTVADEYKDEIKAGKVTVTPLTGLPAGGTGIRVDGEIASKKNGSLIIIPVRDKVLKVWTEGDQFKNDFNNFVLKNLKYNP